MRQTEDRLRLPVHNGGEFCYHIMIEDSYDNFMSEFDAVFQKKNAKICVITDSEVAKLYKNELKNIFIENQKNVFFFIFDAGEASKNLDTIQKLYLFLINNHFERKDVLVALGGGVVGDMTGYAAATYLRGIDFIQMPTTLLSQVDSSIGGKTGVDFDQYKNMVGAFKFPKLVYINSAVLRTLPQDQFASGMAEALKSGLIKDKKYFQYLSAHVQEISAFDETAIFQTIYGSCSVKRNVVENDPYEAGERALLNFGHTIGHAIEKLSDFKLLHGECVALGMVAAAYISYQKGHITLADVQVIEEALTAYHLPVRLELTKYPMDAEAIIAATKSDKKMEAGQIKFVLLRSLGDAYIDKTITDEQLLAGIQYIIEK